MSAYPASQLRDVADTAVSQHGLSSVPPTDTHDTLVIVSRMIPDGRVHQSISIVQTDASPDCDDTVLIMALRAVADGLEGFMQ